MKCPACEIDLPDGSRFCRQCGTRLELLCPYCKTPNNPESRFCMECGHPLTSSPETAHRDNLSFDEKLSRLKKYLPTGLTEKILSQKDRIEGERRNVTIMFVDMESFTPLTEKLGPEETFMLMDQIFEIIIQEINGYEGTVNELRGDGVLALFGAPIALEDAPQRAIRSSLAIHQALARFNGSLEAKREIPPVHVRIGINSGPVVVGTLGNDLRVQFTAVGDTINMAARMEQLAEPQTTYVTEETFKLTEGFFRFEALGEKKIKGKAKPQIVYRVLGASPHKTRFDVSAERGLTRFVGRRRELEILMDAFDMARSGTGQVVSVMGEAGMGKSRLLYEFRKATAEEVLFFWEGRCFSYGRGVGYQMIIDMLKSNFGLEEDEGSSIALEKIKAGLVGIGVDDDTTLPRLLELLSMAAGDTSIMQMSPQARKDRTLSALKRMVLKGSESKPLILAFEDLHFADESSLDAARYLFESVPGSRILMIFTFRPEFVPTWGSKSFHTIITLNRLSNRESTDMAVQMLGGAVAPEFQQLLVKNTEGVPFFIEEFVRTLSSMDLIRPPNQVYHLGKGINNVRIPATIQDVIMARVDSLPEGAREVLQCGSVIEQEFSHGLLRAITNFPEQDLLSHLSVLKNAELVYERGIFPQSAYVFKHAITRKVIYDSILTSRKKSLHHKVGNAIEELYKDNLDPYHSILAEHFMISEDFQKSAEYCRLTYEKARLQAALPLALSYERKRIAALERLPLTPDIQEQVIEARTFLGQTLFIGGNFAEAREAIEPVVQMALQNPQAVPQRSMGPVHLILGSYQYSIEEDFESAFKQLLDSVKSSEAASDLPTATLANVFYGLALCWDCQFEKGAENIRTALGIAEAAQITWNISALNSYLSYYTYNCQGRVKDGFNTSLKALQIAEKSGDILSRAMAYVCHGISHYYRGFFTEAEDGLSKGTELSERIGLQSLVAIAYQAMGYVHFENRDYEKAKASHRKAVLVREQTGIFPSSIHLNKMAEARAALSAGETGYDIPGLKELLRMNKLRLYRGTMARHCAEIQYHLGAEYYGEVHKLLLEAMADHEQLGMNWDLAHDHTVLAQLLKAQGRAGEEEEHLRKAALLFEKCGAEGWSRKINSRSLSSQINPIEKKGGESCP